MSKLPIIGISGKSGSGKDTVANYIVENYNGVVVSLADPMKRFCCNVFGFTDEELWGTQAQKNALVDLSSKKQEIKKGFATEVNPDNNNGFLVQVMQSNYAPLILYDWFDSTYIKIQNTPVSPRELLQSFGTEFGRKLNTSPWTQYAMRTMRQILSENRSYDRSTGLGMEKSTNYAYIVIPDCRFKDELIYLKEWGRAATIKLTRPDIKEIENGIKNHASETEMDSIPDSLFDIKMTNDGTLDDLKRNTKTAMNIMYPDITLTKWNL
jgi:hypothetical protein